MSDLKKTGTPNELITWLLNQDREQVFEIKEHKAKRSLNANSYLWVLVSKLAAKLNLPADEIYREYIRDVGVARHLEVKDDTVDTIITAWTRQGLGWQCERLDNSDTQGFVLLRAYYGSSAYSSAQMARLVDNVVQDCKEQDIETMPPHELQALVDRWGDER